MVIFFLLPLLHVCLKFYNLLLFDYAKRFVHYTTVHCLFNIYFLFIIINIIIDTNIVIVVVIVVVAIVNVAVVVAVVVAAADTKCSYC